MFMYTFTYTSYYFVSKDYKIFIKSTLPMFPMFLLMEYECHLITYIIIISIYNLLILQKKEVCTNQHTPL